MKEKVRKGLLRIIKGQMSTIKFIPAADKTKLFKIKYRMEGSAPDVPCIRLLFNTRVTYWLLFLNSMKSD